MAQKAGWYEVPGKGRRYWTGSEYRFYGPSDNPANKGSAAVNLDIGGMWNNLVKQYGSNTSDPTKVGQQSFERNPPVTAAKIPVAPSADTKQEPYTVMGVTYDPASGQAIQPDTGEIAPGGYSIPASGTDTSSGNREALRSAGGDPAMVAWATANPELAKSMVATQDRRLETNPDFKQSGYTAVRDHLYPERAVLAAEGNMGDFSVRDGMTMGMSPENAGTIGSGGSVETIFEPGKDPVTTSAPQQAFDLLTSYKQGLTNPAVEEAPTDKAPANMIGLDYDQVNAKMKGLGGEEYLRQLDAGKFTRR